MHQIWQFALALIRMIVYGFAVYFRSPDATQARGELAVTGVSSLHEIAGLEPPVCAFALMVEYRQFCHELAMSLTTTSEMACIHVTSAHVMVHTWRRSGR